uniref:Uncharacterized protein n=1 Tax=Arion vulgaris TaxID=1028688 RepID=A0A0B6ZDJ0_9EUPU
MTADDIIIVHHFHLKLHRIPTWSLSQPAKTIQSHFPTLPSFIQSKVRQQSIQPIRDR